MNSRLVLLFSVVLAFVLMSSSVAVADSNKVLQVFTVQVKPGQLETYVDRVNTLQGIYERLGLSATNRVWQATLAGDGVGTVVVGVEYPSLTAFAEGEKKVQADPEYQQVIAGLAEIRTLVARSLYDEITR